MNKLYICLYLLLPLRATAQDSVQHQTDSLRQAISTQHGLDKVKSYHLLASYLFDSSSLEELTTLFKEYETIILQEQEKDKDKSKERTQEYTLHCASTKLNLAYVLFNYGDFDNAATQARNAMEYSRENELWIQYYKDYSLLLDALMEKKKYEALKQEAQKLYQDAKERNDPPGMVYAVHSLANAYMKQYRFAEAEQYCRECIALSAKTDFANVCYPLTEAHLYLSEALTQQQKYPQALKALQETEATVQRLETLEAQKGRATHNKRISLYIIYAEYHLKTKDHHNSEHYSNLAEELIRSIEATESIDDAKLHSIRAQIAEARGQYAQALKLAEHSQALLEAMSSAPIDINSTLNLKARLLIRLGKGEESIALYDSIQAITTRTLNTDFNARLDEIRTIYEVDKHIAEKLRHRNNFLFALCGCALLTLALGIWIYHSRTILRKNHGLYRQIKEQDRLAEELENMRQRYAAVDTLHETPQNNDSNIEQRRLVSRLQEYLLENRNYAKVNISRDELITALSTNRTTLSESIRAVTGKTPMEYVNSLRLEKARQMLEKHPEHTIEAIAEECGFTFRTFYRLFRERYNFTPAEYRKIVATQA